MPECEILSTCVYLTNNLQGLPKLKKKIMDQYCHGDYRQCGGYIIYQAYKSELDKIKLPGYVLDDAKK